MIRTPAIGALGTLLVAVAVCGLAAQADRDRIDCTDGGSTQYEMNVCAARAASEASDKLDALIAELNSTLEPAERSAFEEIQALWVDFRERQCRWQVSFFEGGSIQPMLYSHCLEARTAERIDSLKILLCEGRGMTGPCDASGKY